jgi:hypothetical protein
MTTQPEALRLADYLTDRNRLDLTCDEAANELRRLHGTNTELLAALKMVLSESYDGPCMMITAVRPLQQ